MAGMVTGIPTGTPGANLSSPPSARSFRHWSAAVRNTAVAELFPVARSRTAPFSSCPGHDPGPRPAPSVPSSSITTSPSGHGHDARPHTQDGRCPDPRAARAGEHTERRREEKA